MFLFTTARIAGSLQNTHAVDGWFLRGTKSSCPCEPLNDSGVSLHKPSAVFMFLSKITLTKVLRAHSYFYGALCVCQSCSQSFPCAGRTVRNAFLSNGPYPAKDKIHLARIIRYTCLWVCAHGQIDVSSEARPPTHQSLLASPNVCVVRWAQHMMLTF